MGLAARSVRLVSLLGTSPGTVRTVACKLLEEGVTVSEYYIVVALEEYALEAIEILERCPCPSTVCLRGGVQSVGLYCCPSTIWEA